MVSFKRILFLSAFATLSSAQAKLPDPQSARDLTSVYQQNLAAASEIDVYPSLQKLHVIFVPGFFSRPEKYIKSHIPKTGTSTGQYLDPKIDWLQKLGISAEILEMRSEDTIEENAKIITHAIESAPSRILFVSHSKGSLDLMEALITHPELQDKTAGWIAMNAPFWGTPLANAFSDNAGVRYAVGKALGWIGGTEASVRNMTLEVREEYQTKRSSEILSIVQKIPFLSLATWKPNQKGWDTNLEPIRNFLDWQGYQNDGAVPWQSTILPESDYVLIHDVDHITTFGDIGNENFDRIANLKALIHMVTTSDRFKAEL